ncbi:TonB-dependent receptor [Flavobacterium agricola]|uniref:TonB-dependent receptor n=1 Tax=Flavobacterium agricola TaxID=2870839 RepID=A0ABY6M1P1_9FLAO|nr:TonB-dependent receptor [Flavobacterium agricola]UYW02456.1 TonB-dependent receptor [Flavobacterium agricola]
MLKKTILFCLPLAIPFSLYAKEYHATTYNVIQSFYKLQVMDEYNQPVVNAMLEVEGYSLVFFTDENGMVELPKTLQGKNFYVSLDGYITIHGIVGFNTDLVLLEDNINQLDEIVVVGYGDSKRKNLTSSIGKVKTKNISPRNVSSANQLLQGQVAGVNLTTANGTPGSRSRVSIRGISSINGDNEPLYVIDGIPISKSNASYNYSGEFVQDPLSLINPSDIESMDVLKDAAATAIYGSRGANGVIIINTKQGKKGKLKFSFSQLTGLSTMPKKMNLLSSDQYINLQNEAVNNYNQDFGYIPGKPGYIDINKVLGKVPENYTDIGWQDLIIRNAATTTQTDFSVSGGNEKVKTYNSIGYAYQEGLINKSSLKRYSLRSNVNYKPNDKFDLGFNIAGNFTQSSSIPNGDQGTALFQRSLEQRPYDSPYLANGDYSVGGKDILRHNALIILDKDHTDDKNYQSLINLYGAYHFLNGFTFKTSYNSELRIGHGARRQEIGHPYNGGLGWINDSRNTRYSQAFDNVLSYEKTLFDVFNVNAMIGHSYFSDKYTFNTVTGREFPANDFKHINAATIVTGSSSMSEYAIESYFGRLNLGFDDKYLVSATIRRDGSSKFNKDYRYDYFPSVSAGWIFSSEKFMNNVNFINFGKLRASWGKTGNQDGIGNYDYFALAQGGYNYNGTTGLSITSIGNKNLKWEVNTQSDIGIDLSFLSNRLNFTYDFFIKESKDLLYNVPILQTSGFSNMTQNIGKLRNVGHEFTISSINISNPNFTWTTNLNLSLIKNEVKSLLGDGVVTIGNWNAIIEGQPLGVFYGYEHQGIYQTVDQIPTNLYNQGVRPGDIIYADINGDGQINSSDRTVIGNSQPDFFGGFTNTFKYKNFDMSIFATFSVGNDIVSNWRTGLDHLGGTDYNNIASSYNDRWTGPGTSNWVPRATKGSWNTKNSSYYIEDGSYLRLKNLTVGYTLPEALLQKIGFENIRVFATVNNLFTITNYSGYDPEAASGTNAASFGIDNLVTPQPRSFLLGITIN